MVEKEKRGLVKVTFGGWYQRTTLHLTEVYEFLARGRSRLELSKGKLRRHHEKLDLKSVVRVMDNLEYVKAVTNSEIEIRYYEDGLYIIETYAQNVEKAIEIVKDYFEKNFKPAINYIFSLGTPTPKILSNIKEEHPVVISVVDRYPTKFKIPRKFGVVYNKILFRDMSVYKTPGYIFLITQPDNAELLENLIGMQIFFREFKDQLHKYLNIHREIWEEIEKIKEKKYVKGKEVSLYRSQLEAYKKTIDLINYRINQMPAYARTRESLAKDLNVNKNLVSLFQYRFEDLFSTLDYIKQIWAMTVNYVSSAIQVLVEIDSKRSVSGIRSIQILASIGVVTGIIGYLSSDELPVFNKLGAAYLVVLGVSALVLDYLFKKYFKNKKYRLKFVQRHEEI